MGVNIIRAPRDKDNTYTVVSNRIIGDPLISGRAKGVLLYALSKPDDWELREADVVNHMKEGRDAIRAALKELCELGYLFKVKGRSEGGKFLNVFFRVSDTPIFKESPEPLQTEDSNDRLKNRVGKSVTDNPTLSKYSELSTEKTSTEVSSNNRPNFDPEPEITKTFKSISWSNDLAVNQVEMLAVSIPIWLEGVGCTPSADIGSESIVSTFISLIGKTIASDKVTCLSVHSVALQIGMMTLAQVDNDGISRKRINSNYLLNENVLRLALYRTREYTDSQIYSEAYRGMKEAEDKIATF